MNDAKQVFLAALDKDTPQQLIDYLDEACAGDPTLRDRVEELLRAHREAGNFLGGAQPIDTEGVPPSSEAPGAVIGPYKLLEQIGEGGFGVVFAADQQHPVRRRVALKVIKPGMDTREVIARFEAERQALAIMDHPNIARVLDAGATDSGRPYFVMELVRGVSITEYCDQQLLTPRERLELFLPVCHAVQHAHQKGIIHRDIKPTNVLVTSHDGRPVVKVIDFGVAKAISGQLSEHTVYTRFAQMIGTPLYMSPEQAEMSGLDIDTRTDIYSLGVLLYELLTGTTPFDRKRLSKAALDEVRRIIREEEPPKPSTRLSESGDSLPSIAANRHTEPARLTKLLRGDLDWIVMKALEKDRQRRYESANGLANDVQRYLVDEPVEACPPSAGYKLSKFARKNRAALATAGTIAALLIVGTAVSLWQAVRATRALAESVEERRLAQAVGDYLVEAFTKPDPEQDGREVKVVDVLDEAARKLDSEFTGSARTKAVLLETLGKTYMGLGVPEKAQQAYEKARAILQTDSGADDVETILCSNDLAITYRVQGRVQEAIALLEKAQKQLTAKLGANDLRTIRCASDLADAYRDDVRYEEAITLGEEVLRQRSAQLGPEDHLTLLSMSNLAHTYFAAGRREEALKLFEENLRLRRKSTRPDHPATLMSMNNLALAYAEAGRLDEATELSESALDFAGEVLGPDNAYMTVFMGSLANIYSEAKQFDKAIPLVEATLKRKQEMQGHDHPSTLLSMNNLAMIYRHAGQKEKALPLFEEALQLTEKRLGRENPQTLTSMNNLALGYADAGRLQESAKLFEETLLLCKVHQGPDHNDTLATMSSLADVYRELNRLSDAAPLAEEALRLLRDKISSDHPQLFRSIGNLAGIYVAQERTDEANSLFRELVDVRKSTSGAESDAVAELLAQIGWRWLEQRKYIEADPYLREALSVQEKTQPDDWTTSNTKSMLGGALLGQEKFAEAEPLLLAGYEGMNANLESFPSADRIRLREAAERLVALYDAWNKPDEEAKWRTTLDALQLDDADAAE